MKCATCNLVTGTEAVPESFAARYAELGIPCHCQHCRDLERKSPVESIITQRGAYTVYGTRGATQNRSASIG